MNQDVSDQHHKSRAERVAARQAQQDANPFGRVLAAATAARGQAQRLLGQCSDLSITEWRILWDLAEAGPLSVQDMAKIQRTDHSLISRALPAMRAKGLVSTARGTKDKRQSLVALAPEGRRAFDAAAPIMKHRRASLAACFSGAEMTDFLDLLTRFDTFVQQTLEPPLPARHGPEVNRFAHQSQPLASACAAPLQSKDVP